MGNYNCIIIPLLYMVVCNHIKCYNNYYENLLLTRSAYVN